MRKNLIQVSVLTAAVLVLNGCGGSDSTTTPVAATGTAFYVDSAVEGVSVTCGSTMSTTDANGQFMYEEGQDCMFRIGDIVLRRESDLYQDKVVMEDNLQTAQFLQSMDYDGNPDNGIMIHPQTAEIMAQNGISQMPNNDQELADACVNMQDANIGYQGEFVYEQDAQEHMNRTMEWYRERDEQYMDQPDNHQDSH